MANAANLINFGAGGSLAIGDWTYSAYPLSAPAYLPLNSDEASYLVSSYPTLGAIYTTPVAAYSASTVTTLNKSITEIAYGNGIFVGINTTVNAYQYVTSFDGVTWTARVFYSAKGTGALAQTYSITFANGVFVVTANGANDTNNGTQVYVSPDGLNWTKTELLPTLSFPCYAIYGNNFWLLINSNATYFKSLNNGTTWAAYDPNVPSSASGGRAFGNNIFVTGGFSIGVNAIASSTDLGYSWALRSTSSGQYSSIAFGNGIFVAVETSSTSTKALTSTDGVTWTLRTLPSSSAWKAVVFGNGVFLAISSTGTDAATSTDGITWTARVLGSSALVCNALCVGGAPNAQYFIGYNSAGATSHKINLAVAQTNFKLPTVPTIRNTIPYIKAT